MEGKKEVWLNVSTERPARNAKAATLHAIGDTEKEWMEKGWIERMKWEWEWMELMKKLMHQMGDT